MKKILNAILVLVLIITVSLSMVYASEDEIKVMINGEYIEFDVEPQIINDRTMVPFRAIFEAMGAKVEWNQELWQAIGEKDGKKVSMIIDSNEITITENGGEEIVKIDQSPIIVEGRTMVPARFVAEAFDKIVSWDDIEKTVIILDLQGFADEMKEKAPNFYEYISTLNTIPNNLKQTDEFEFTIKAKDNEYSQEAKASFVGNIESIVNENDAYLGLDMEVDLFNIDGNLSKEKENITVSTYIQNNNLLISTNLLELIGEDEFNLKYGIDGIYENVIKENLYSMKKDGVLFNIEEFGILGVSNFKELKEFINFMLTDFDEASSYINNAITSQYIHINANDVREITNRYDMILNFVSNNNFKKKEISNQMIYTLKIDKECIVDIMKNMDLYGMNADSKIVEELTMYKDIDISINFYVKNNITKKVTLDVNANIEKDNLEGTIEINSKKNVTNIGNRNIKITHPKYENAAKMYTSYEEVKQSIPIDFETNQDIITAQINENLKNGKDKFYGLTSYTEETFPSDENSEHTTVMVLLYGSEEWGIDKNGVIYYTPGFYFEDDNITMLNNDIYYIGKGKNVFDVKKELIEENCTSFMNAIRTFKNAFEEVIY